MKTTYLINPRIKKHWFKQNSVVYDLIKYSEEVQWCDNTFGNGGGNFMDAKTTKTIFSSPNIEEVITIKNNLER